MTELIDILGAFFKALLSTNNQAFIICCLFLLSLIGVLAFYLWKQQKEITELKKTQYRIAENLKKKNYELKEHQKQLLAINRIIEDIESENKLFIDRLHLLDEKINKRE
ncbi:MAG: hypothetical protein QNJ31_07610 [Candidatus Caenarcaniphilales bacterium]|nr:hypothetical protein [Candidatus Caenarcaniphilales bacterium]